MPRNSTHALQREKELAVVLSRHPIEPAARERARRLVSEGVDWQPVIERAKRWQVEPVVLGNLREHFASDMDTQTLVEVIRLEQLARVYAVAQTLRVVDLANSLRDAGVPALVLKGPAIAIAAYGDCSRRTFTDIDLVVAKTDLPAAQAHLLDRGYTPLFEAEMVRSLIDGQHALEFSGPGPHVEVHWSLLSRHLRFDLGPDELWNEAVELKCVGSQIRALAPHHLFHYLCAHGAKHEWMLFRWICDVAQLARRLTPKEAERVMQLAERTHSRRIVSLALRLVREVFGEEPSPFPSGGLRADSSMDALVAVAKARFDPGPDAAPSLLPRRLAGVHAYAEPLAFWIRSRERRRDQIVCAARFVFEPAPGDRSGGRLKTLLRPARLAANALMRAVHAQ